MTKFNADEAKYEPIEVVLDGKTYAITKVSQDLFDKIKEASKTVDGEEKDSKVVFRQLGAALNEDPKVFEKLDLRKAGAILRFLTETITAQIEGKNV
jgi:hypothetical protein